MSELVQLRTQWRQQLKERSGNLTTSESMPQALIEKLLEEDENLADKITLKPADLPQLDGILGEIQGLNILAGLQRKTKEGYLTLFRGVRMPTYKRLYGMVSEHGFALSNYEQERILELYNEREYIEKRNQTKIDPHFWTQPQERVVHGLPLFFLVNDALQIHRAYRGNTDQTAIVAIHIPEQLLESEKIRLVANATIDLDYDNAERDFEIKDFVTKGGVFQLDFGSLRARGIDLHEMYTRDLPMSLDECERLGIIQEYYLVDIYRIVDHSLVNELKNNAGVLKENKDFLHGFFGDQSIFGRRQSEYLPSQCRQIKRK